MKILIFSLFSFVVFACTDFVVIGKDGSYVNGRSLEFAMDLNSKLQVSQRGAFLTSQAPGGQKGISWKAKYGFLAVTSLDIDLAFDGMNEKGLSFGYLWLPEYTQYSKPKGKNILDFVDFCRWVLGNFQSVDEVLNAVSEIQVWGHTVPELGNAPVHAAIHDAMGKSIVIEFVDGKMEVYRNPLSVLTNAPPFPWHVMNIQNYLNLSALNPMPSSFRGMEFDSPGQGGGLVGLPGDWSPPSRFVKIFTLLRFAEETQDPVNLAAHLLNTVDIPYGVVREKNGSDYTQWIVIKDLTHKTFYFRSYGDLALKVIDLNKIDFSKENKNSLPLDLKKGYLDVTNQLTN